MNMPIPQHSPTPQFRASLEAELLRALRDDSAGLPPSMWRRHRARLRTAATLAVGLVLGVGTQFASAQVQANRQQSELVRVKESERQVAAIRAVLARAALEEARAKVNSGAALPRAVTEAESNVRFAELALAKLDIELDEIRATSAMPRDEIWAPKVGERDFVLLRLTLEAAAAQQRLRNAEAEAEAINRHLQLIGNIEVQRMQDSRLELAEAKRRFNVLAQRLQLREQFLKEKLAPEEVTRRLEWFDITAEIQAGQEELKTAEARLKVLREQHATGNATTLELKRAELEVLERQAGLELLSIRYKQLTKPEP